MMILPKHISCGYFDSAIFNGTLKVTPLRRITQYEVDFYLDDGGTTTRDGKTYEIKKNHIRLSVPGQTANSVLPFRTVYMRFDAEGELADLFSAAPTYFPVSNPKMLRAAFEELIALDEKDDKLLLHSHFLLLLNMILKESTLAQVSANQNTRLIADAKAFIEENLHKPLKLSDIATSVHLSPIYFHGIFSHTVGISPHQYLIRCRIEQIKRLLRNPDIPMSVIAERSGFGNQQYMNTVFKRETNVTPGEYRRLSLQKYIL